MSHVKYAMTNTYNYYTCALVGKYTSITIAKGYFMDFHNMHIMEIPYTDCLNMYFCKMRHNNTRNSIFFKHRQKFNYYINLLVDKQ